MSNIFKLTAEYRQLLEMMEDPEIDEQAVADTMEGIEMEIEQKADNYAGLIRSLEGSREIVHKEAERLQALDKRYENFIKRLKENLMFCMRATGKEKFKTALNSFGIRKAGGKQPLDIDIEDPEKIPEEYRKEVVKYSADNDKIREALDKGEELSWARYAERTEYLSIR
jgi:hypothetical protein